VWPRIFPRAAYARLKIIEKGLPEKLGALARQSPRLDVPGYVDNLEEHLKDAGVWVVPLFAGSGITVKILTALSYGVPVVTTSIGCEGIVAQSG
jgi:glycosyltransferase involved in cell wall biosynthesis